MAQFLAAFIEESGGEIRLAFDTIKDQTGDRAITLDFEDEGATIVLRVIDTKDIPDDVE
jgi:hypothetical protein